MTTSEALSLSAGDTVRESSRRCPPGCQPFTATVTAIAPDGWVMFRTQYGSELSFPPADLDRMTVA